MKKLLYLAAATVLCASCFNVNMNFKGSGKGMITGTGPVETRTLDLRDFTGICVKGGAGVKFSQADSFAVRVSTQENIFDSLDFEVKDSVLFIQTIGHRRVNADKYEINLTMPSLSSIEVDGAVDFEALTAWKASGDVSISVNGAGEISFDSLTCQKLDVEINGASELDASGLDVSVLSIQINGAGDVEVSGKAGEADLRVAGAGDIDARNLKVAGEVRKKTAGAARIRL